MRVIVGCEYSGVVRRAFRALGHDAWYCDLLPSEDNSEFHIQGDISTILGNGWELGIFHPPCTDIAVSGAKFFKEKIADGRQERALDFVRFLMAQDIPRIAIENPVSVISSKIRKPDQIIQPWMFGHTEQKSTCLWLKGLPKLRETNNVRAEMMLLPQRDRERLYRLPPSPTRWKERSRTFSGIGEAFAEQWSNCVC